LFFLSKPQIGFLTPKGTVTSGPWEVCGMSQEGVAQGSQTPQVSEEEKQMVMDSIGVGFSLVELGIIHMELLMMGCLTPPESFMLEGWHRRAREALDHNEMDKAIEWTKKMVDFLEERQKLCDRLMNKSRKHSKRYSRHSSRH
jgi:hypothetical protein